VITAWLALTLSLAAVTGFAVWSRRDTHARTGTVLALLVAAPVAYYSLTIPLSLPAENPAHGEWTVEGARIDVDVAIWVLLSQAGGEPRFYVLPYTAATANKLQQAMDAAREGEGPRLEMTESGEAVFHEPPVRADPPKQPEEP
jgi:hypothetical protein